MALVAVLTGVVPARRRFCALVLASALVALVPLADASPPDSTWVAGLYDDGDFDEVVASVVSGSGIVSKIGFTEAADLTAEAVWRQHVVVGVAADVCSFTIRAPPLHRTHRHYVNNPSAHVRLSRSRGPTIIT